MAVAFIEEKLHDCIEMHIRVHKRTVNDPDSAFMRHSLIVHTRQAAVHIARQNKITENGLKLAAYKTINRDDNPDNKVIQEFYLSIAKEIGALLPLQ